MTEKKKKIIGKRVRLGIGKDVHFEDEENVVVGSDTTLIVSPEETEGMEIIGEQIVLQVGGAFDSVLKQINERKDLNPQTKEELEVKVKELENELEKKPSDLKKIERLKSWFKGNASWLLPAIVSIVDKILT